VGGSDRAHGVDAVIRKQWTPALERVLLLRPGTSDQTIWENTFERGQHLPPDAMPVPATVLDLGANIGLTAAAYRGMWPESEIIAVEMDPGNCKMARQNFSGAVIEGACVYERIEGLGYDRSVYDASYTLGTGKTPATQVPFAEILRYFARPVDFCKMDIEGQEEEIISHASEWVEWVNHLLVECHEAVGGYQVEDALDDLWGAGYKAAVRNIGIQQVWAWR
jgi:FkbM family methyltransferase